MISANYNYPNTAISSAVKNGTSSPAPATDGRGGVFYSFLVAMQLVAGLIFAPVLFLVGAVLASTATQPASRLG